jgi:hypothetical protein
VLITQSADNYGAVDRNLLARERAGDDLRRIIEEERLSQR